MQKFQMTSSPFTVDVPKDLKTAGHLKEHIIGMVCRRTGVYLRQWHARLSDRITGMPLPYNMPFETLLESVTGKSLNLWLNLWTDSYRFAITFQIRLGLQAFYTDGVAPSAGLTATTGGVAPIYTEGVAPGSRRRLSGDTQ